MRILHVIPRFIGGGPERHLLALAAAWRTQGLKTRHQVAVLDPPISAPLLIKARRLGLTIMARPSDDDLDEAIRDADVVEINYWNHPRLLDLLRRNLPAARLLVRSAVAGIAPPQALLDELGRFADAMIITSSASWGTPGAKAARDAGKQIEFIPALADMSRLEGFVARPHKGIRVGYLGLVEPTKMHPRFAELTASVRNPDIHFDVFGGGSWVPQLRRRLGELGADRHVHFHGYVENLRTAFSEIDVFGYPLAPDTYATSEKALQEAMWAGIPSVVLAGNGASVLVEHERTGMVCDTEEEYPQAINLLASDAELRQRLGIAARNFARCQFDPVRNGERFRAVFDAVAAMPRRKRDPLPGRGDSAARRFVLGLGELGGPFAVSTAGTPGFSIRAVANADATIAQASEVLARSEGGIIHYRNTFPDDGLLRLWSGLVAAQGCDNAKATLEFDAAANLGVPRNRIRNAIAVVPGYRREP